MCTETRLTVFVMVLAVVFARATGLVCFGCIYYEGAHDSTDDCKAESIIPGYDRTCTALNSVHMGANTSSSASASHNETKAIGDFLCVKISGRDEGTGAAVLWRGCGLQMATNEDGICSYTEEDLLLSGFGTITAGARQFKCSQSLCNDGSIEAACDTSGAHAVTSTHKTFVALIFMFLAAEIAKLIL